MPFDSESFNIDDALASSQDVYEVQITDWGCRTVAAGQTAVNPNFQFPPPGAAAVPASLAAMAIGPRSTVDRVWVTWDRQKLVAAVPGSGEVQTVVRESRTRPMSVQHPLLFAQATRQGVLPSTLPFPPTENLDQNNSPVRAMHDGLLYVFPKDSSPPYIGSMSTASSAGVMSQDPNATTILPASIKDQAGAVWPFFPQTADFGTIITPYLELYLYLRPPLQSPPTARFPYFVASESEAGIGSGANQFVPVVYIPIFGRKHIGIGLRSNEQTTDFRIGLVRCIRENELVSIKSPPFEVPAGLATGVAAGVTVNFSIQNPCADYLTIFAKAAAATFVNYEVAAYD